MITTDIRETHRCERCGSRLESNGVRETCLRCALDAVLQDNDSAGLVEPSNRSESSPCLRRFGDYDLLAEVARGGMGVVYRARHVGLDREVALKMVLFGEFADPDTLERFQVEARTGARLKHPHIVAIHDLGTLDGRPWFTMDLIDGPNLSDAFRSGLPEPREAAQLLLLIVEAITYAHGQGVLHRDLKPSNILLDSAGHPHVTDFGLARLITDDSTLTQTGQALGSPNYMAPEQAAGTRATGAAADIWSLGAILHFLLTGRPPFAGASVADTMRAVREDDPVSPRRLNARIAADLETICLKCLEKEPTRAIPLPKRSPMIWPGSFETNRFSLARSAPPPGSGAGANANPSWPPWSWPCIWRLPSAWRAWSGNGGEQSRVNFPLASTSTSRT